MISRVMRSGARAAASSATRLPMLWPATAACFTPALGSALGAAGKLGVVGLALDRLVAYVGSRVARGGN